MNSTKRPARRRGWRDWALLYSTVAGVTAVSTAYLGALDPTGGGAVVGFSLSIVALVILWRSDFRWTS